MDGESRLRLFQTRLGMSCSSEQSLLLLSLAALGGLDQQLLCSGRTSHSNHLSSPQKPWSTWHCQPLAIPDYSQHLSYKTCSALATKLTLATLRKRAKHTFQETKLGFVCSLEKSVASVVLMTIPCLPLIYQIPFKITVVFSSQQMH